MSYLSNFLDILEGTTSDRPVWTADLEYWLAGREYDGTINPEWRTEEGFLKLCSELGIMPYFYYGSSWNAFWLAEPEYDESVRISTVRDGRKTKTRYTTPVGELIEQTEFMPTSCSEAHIAFPVQTHEDFETFRYLIEHRRLKPVLLEDYEARRELWKRYDGIPSIAMPRSPLAAFFYEWAGIINGVYLLTDCRDEVKELFDVMLEQEEPIISAVCAAAPPLVHFADNMASDNMTGFYDELMYEGHRRRLDRFHAAGIKCAVHLDGVVRGLLPKLAAAGFDAIEALTPKPNGDMDVEEMREGAKSDTVVLWGGVPGVLFSPPSTWDDMNRYVKRTLEAWEGTPFILGVADQVPPDGNIDFCKRIAEMVG